MTNDYLLTDPIVEFQRGGKYTNPFMSERLGGVNRIFITNDPLDSGIVITSYNLLNSITLIDTESGNRYLFTFLKPANVNIYVAHLVDGTAYTIHILKGVEWEVRKIGTRKHHI